MSYQPLFVPRAGVEPARVAPLVFETSASTDSAIWAALPCLMEEAESGAKVRIFSETARDSGENVEKTEEMLMKWRISLHV